MTEIKQNETPISKAIKAKLRLVDDEVEGAWLGDRSHIYAELDPPRISPLLLLLISLIYTTEPGLSPLRP
jgi:hypothetical protein